MFSLRQFQKGNTIENKGNTTEKCPIFLFPQNKYSQFSTHKGNTKRETLVWGCSQ